MIYRTWFHFGVICGVVVILLVSACTATPISGPEPLAQTTLEVTIQGDTPGREEVQTIELDNCGGKADATRIEQRTQSVDVTISTELAAKIGASVEVVSAEVQAAVGLAISPRSERSTSIQLAAPPHTRMVFDLVWVGNEQIGIVQNIHNSDIPVAFRSFLPTDVRIRSQADIGCSGSSTPQAVFEPTTPLQMPVSTAEPSNNCSKLIEGEHHNPILGTDWKFEAINEDRIIHVWSNHWNPNLPEYKFFLPAGQAVSFKSGGGAFWIDRPGCDGVAEVLFQRDTFQKITIEEYQKYIELQIIP